MRRSRPSFLGLFFLLPLLKVFGASILDATGTSFTLANYASMLSNRFFLNGLTNSLTIAAAAAVLAVLVGVPFAFCLARLPIGGKPALLALAALPLVLPSFVGAYALVLLFGRSGIVTGASAVASAFRSTRSTARRASSPSTR